MALTEQLDGVLKERRRPDLGVAYGTGVSTRPQYVESAPKVPQKSGVVAYWKPWPFSNLVPG